MASVRPGEDYTPQQHLQDALAAMGCPRPDKHHHVTKADAQSHLRWMRKHATDHDSSAHVYLCPCQLGWVWGRRRTG